MSKQVNYNENLCAGAAIRDDKGRRISKLFEASHPKMTVGYAKNLIMPDTPTEQEFNFRQSGGSVIEDGVAVIDKVKGKSVVWNQIVQNGNFADGTTGWNFPVGAVSVSNNIATVNFEDAYTALKRPSPAIVSGHKYYISIEVKPTSLSDLDFAYGLGGPGYFTNEGVLLNITKGFIGSTDRFTKLSKIGTFTKDSNDTQQPNDIILMKFTGEAQDVQVKNLMCIDLTQMFGAGNEPATYEEFLSRKPKVADEYAYNEGTIVNNKVEKVKTTGVNLWDEEWSTKAISSQSGEQIGEDGACVSSLNYIEVIPSTHLYIKAFYNTGSGNGIYIKCFNSEKVALTSEWDFINVKNQEITLPSNVRYIKFMTLADYGTTYNHDICINLSDPTINGQYFPYEKHELDLSWVKDIKDSEGVKLFEDGMSGVGSVFDVVTATKAIRRFAMIHLGDLRSWTWYSGYAGFYNISILDCAKAANIPCLIAGYNVLEDASFNSSRGTLEAAMAWGTDNAYLKLRNTAFDSTSMDAFIESLQGKYLIYELAEPIEVEYDEKNLTYPVIAGGTEEAIASEPSTAFRADIGYGIDAVKTILDLKARVEALEGK